MRILGHPNLSRLLAGICVLILRTHGFYNGIEISVKLTHVGVGVWLPVAETGRGPRDRFANPLESAPYWIGFRDLSRSIGSWLIRIIPLSGRFKSSVT
jgi:hypothetical protein